jgi:hypothetical protein
MFLERFYKNTRESGRFGILMPSGLYALEGATGLRRLIFSATKVEAIYSFENAFERFFPGVDSRMKFLALVFEKRETPAQVFPAVFMLRDEGFLASPEPQRHASAVLITSDFVRLTSPQHSSVIELRDDRERQFVERIYRQVPALSAKARREGAWAASIHRELDMTDDAWRFHKADWLAERGCVQSGSAFEAPKLEWYEARSERFEAATRYVVPEGTKHRITAVKPPDDEKKKGARGQRLQAVSGFVLASVRSHLKIYNRRGS